MDKKFNELIYETSPYLLQHAYNPVDWHPWGSVALEKSKVEDKPILVSIGYSACHWCHVMERESFEHEETAKFMNENFINIKIDREERPDLDQIYMDAVQAISGSGGWPLNVFLTPEAKPFYGGTYFPLVNSYNRSSWREVLNSIIKMFREQREEVNSKADELVNFLGRDLPFSKSHILTSLIENKTTSIISEKQFQNMFDNIYKLADKKWGGFGKAPKFPQTFSINSLLRYYCFSKDKRALDHVRLSLDKMIQGGIYDQIGGGFSRYSTDNEWLVPHFEKMLYDNALMIISLTEAFQVTKNEEYKKVAIQTISFLIRELKNPKGGYYASIDADSEGIEGKYYVWDYEEIKDLLGKDAILFCEYYDITPEGNWEGKNILRRLKPLQVFAKETGVGIEELKDVLIKSEKILFECRETRIRPATDDKIILGWNALLIIAFCKASSAFSKIEFLNFAEENFSFLMNNLKLEADTSAMYHNYKNGIAKNPAFLDDYSFLINSCICLQECTSNNNYLNIANVISEYVLENFSSDDLFFYTNRTQSDIIIRKKEIFDGAIPSGNSVMNYNLLYLGIIFEKSEWRQIAIKNLGKLSEMIINYPTSFGEWNCLFIILFKGVKEIVITGPDFKTNKKILLKEFIPEKIFQSSNDLKDYNFPLINNRIEEGRNLIYICENYQCIQPISSIDEAINILLK